MIATAGLMRPDASTPGRSVLAFPAASAADPVIPDVPELSGAVEAPASVSEDPRRDSAGLGVLADARGAASVEAVPSRALTAYQRAETVMRQADPSCHLTWQLIAAIGQVESNHGRFGGALMTADGVVHPAILGPRLTGHGATSRIGDTDAGLLDGDQRFDRAVGPMQFIPSTWTVVGVDADGDGRRDPQDIDDASLATAVYLCSGSDDLATRAGPARVVYRYNHSKAYVDLVIGIMAGYLHADPALFRLIGGTAASSTPEAYPYPTGGGGPVPGQPGADLRGRRSHVRPDVRPDLGAHWQAERPAHDQADGDGDRDGDPGPVGEADTLGHRDAHGRCADDRRAHPVGRTHRRTFERGPHPDGDRAHGIRDPDRDGHRRSHGRADGRADGWADRSGRRRPRDPAGPSSTRTPPASPPASTRPTWSP